MDRRTLLMMGVPALALRAADPVMKWADTQPLGRPFSKDPAVIWFGGRYLLYYSRPGHSLMEGWSVGVAESRDLVAWTPVAVIGPEREYEKKGLAAPFATVIDGQVHLFYQTYGNGKNDAICHAVSRDGLKFEKDAATVFHPTGTWTAGRAIDAEVVKFKGRWLMYAATRDPEMKVQMIVGAVRKKGWGEWEMLADRPLLKPELPWEKDCIEAPATVVRGDWLYMFYAGAYNNAPQQIGCARSRDGVNWTRISQEPLLAVGKPGEWNSSESGHPGTFVDPRTKQTYLFYQGNPDKGKTWFLSWVKIGWNKKTGNPFVMS